MLEHAEMWTLTGGAFIVITTANRCSCPEPQWVDFRREVGMFFTHPNLHESLGCLLSGACEAHPFLAAILETSRCSTQDLPAVSSHCPAGMLHLMLICVQWNVLGSKSRQASLYFDQALQTLLLVQDCLDNSEWPITVSQVLDNARRFTRTVYGFGRDGAVGQPARARADQRRARGEELLPYQAAGLEERGHEPKVGTEARERALCEEAVGLRPEL